MRVLLISTYELGHQPLHLAAPAAELAAAGHDIATLDLAVEKWDPAILDRVEAVAISVPMHTALRLAIEVARRIRRTRVSLPIAFYGLYAGVGNTVGSGLVDRAISGEYEDALVDWVESIAGGSAGGGVTVSIGRRRFLTPDRSGLPPLSRYAHLSTPAGHQLVGYVEASHGCRHRCRHCPIPAVYDGRYRITGEETVLADIARHADEGAGHVTFGDPDFLNAPAYSLKVLEEAHRRFPHLTFDVTVKVEHLIQHRHHLERMAEAGVLFVVSAVETLDDAILRRLDKGHTAGDAARAVELLRGAGIDIHPTWLPFTPWTTAASVADIAGFVWEHDVAPVTDPVQLSIRLLIPDGSLLLDLPDLKPYLLGYDDTSLGYRWRSADPAMDELQTRLGEMADRATTAGEDSLVTLRAMTEVIAEAGGRDIPAGAVSVTGRPRLTEPWFC